MMAYSALLLTGPPGEVAVATATGIVALIAVAVAIEGFLVRRASVLERVILTVAAAMIMIAPEWADWSRALLGASPGSATFVWGGTAVALTILALQFVRRGRVAPHRRAPAEATPATA